MNRRKVAVVVGTRPEVIKMAPVVFALRESKELEPVLLSTGQHREMLDQALAAFDLKPDFDLGLMQPGQTLPGLTARAIEAVTKFIDEQKPDAILVQGDTSTVLAAAMAAFFADVPVGHIEAGLRTGNMRSPFPEEMNRRLTSPLAKWHFCPTDGSKDNLVREAIAECDCYVTGNTVVDSLLWIRDKQESAGVDAADVAKRLGISNDFAQKYFNLKSAISTDEVSDFVLVTGHRRESFGGGFERMCEAINDLTKRHPGVGVLYPVHLNPKVQEPVNRILGDNPAVELCSPAGYEDFVWLMNQAKFILSDSGGVQEEAPSLGKPVLVMRETTERPEGVEAGTCRLVGTDPDKILSEAAVLLDDADEYARRSALKNPYGDGTAARKIVATLEASLGKVES
ncbi:non-hydrolyzing UDP-N-acetylglucosamine 2-epimerase [Sulfuriroseicoccus oceanibius]|uniref:UDP-N-acetylglucosamine 2-epimerase (non-hydrolyzing) n=1 Tax=Sulfuriroseicoccus oceanibius TaxID=2707525 RepID=A0A6B3L948_9BACT|nr:UDP-N-acetylglucosamine 2-epimerase (non-hydrolyzing) [Sulfuriroseicoccus oceanibius]QQL44309.1 UDP-N-acetylglucosamine 2-epimerase (non-hydrolyzing) [Sulfuriroseicoccus oceanibius]